MEVKVQVLGSHQNVFTSRMVEGLGLGHRHAIILPLSHFPKGILFHHEPSYMRKLEEGKVHPYHFHMCCMCLSVCLPTESKAVTMEHAKYTDLGLDSM